ncbi:hypothetical protein ACFYVL_35385 [Streptomyces sp. NPDC004111]|uniref:hypothetical protein n=1 Tax=Streptomyces sp. NPDC004111 TaxID=3364690 RepID=UPI0036ACE78C
MDIKKAILYILVVFVLYTIITSPDKAANMVGLGFQGLSDAARGIGSFMTNLVK